MGLAEDRKRMDRALKDILVPELRGLGFGGSYPHFHRLREGHVDLLTIQFNKYGGSFVAEIAYVGSDGQNLFFEERRGAEPKSLRAGDTTERLRLGSDPASKDPLRRGDHWFKFSGFSLSALFGDRCRKRAEEVVARLREQGLPWWDDRLEELSVAERSRPDRKPATRD